MFFFGFRKDTNNNNKKSQDPPLTTTSTLSQSEVLVTQSISPTNASIRSTLFGYFEKGLEHINRSMAPVFRENQSLADPTAEFSEYLASIQQQMGEFKTNRKNHQVVIQAAQQNVEHCYQAIPVAYFMDNFKLDQLPSRRKAVKLHETLTDHLDLTELTLFSQVTAKFTEYLALIGSINQLNEKVQETLSLVKYSRKRFLDIQNSFINKAFKIEVLSRRKEGLQQVVKIGADICRLWDLANSVRETIQAGQWDKQLFENLTKCKVGWEKYRNLKAMQLVGQEIERLQKEVNDYLEKQLDEWMVVYLGLRLSYSKERWAQQGLPKNALEVPHDEERGSRQSVEITVLDVSAFEAQGPELILASIPKYHSICEILTFSSLSGLSGTGCAQIIKQKLTVFKSDFLQDLQEYLLYILQANGKQVQKSTATLQKCIDCLNVTFYSKVAGVYYSIIQTVFCELLEISDNSESQDFLDPALEVLREHVVGAIQQFMRLKRISASADAKTFKNYLRLIDYWLEAEQREPRLKLTSLTSTKEQLVNLYIGNLHKEVMTVQIKQSLENDVYLPMSVPSDYYQQLEYLFNSSDGGAEQTMLECTVNMSLIRRQQHRAPRELGDMDNVKLINKKVNVNGRCYYVSQSFLLLLEVLDEYMRMALELRDFKNNIQEKIAELIGFFNWYMREMLINGAVLKHSQTLKSVMIKHLSLSHHVLCLLTLIVPKLHLPTGHGKDKAIRAHIQDVEKSIAKIIFNRVEDQISALCESKLSPKQQVPTLHSRNIINVLNTTKDTLSDFFSLQESRDFQLPSVKLILKNYVGFTSTVGVRGLQELTWFANQFEAILGHMHPEEAKALKEVIWSRRK